MMIVSVFLPLAMAGAGWTVKGNRLEVNTGFDPVNWPLQDTSATWVTGNRAYQLKVKSSGYNAGTLASGQFTLENGTQAFVFVEGNHPVLLIHRGNQQVMLSTPEVAQLKGLVDKVGLKADHSLADTGVLPRPPWVSVLSDVIALAVVLLVVLQYLGPTICA